MRFALSVLAFLVALIVWIQGDEGSADETPASTVEVATCSESAGGYPNRGWRENATTAGPIGIFGPGRHFRHPHEYPNGNLAAKAPAVVDGHKTVTLRVRASARDRIRLDYGDFDTESEITETPTEIVFEPCADKPTTGWPGGFLMTARRPATLIVQVDGSEQRRTLRVGPRR